jgi:hypothetical protein
MPLLGVVTARSFLVIVTCFVAFSSGGDAALLPPLITALRPSRLGQVLLKLLVTCPAGLLRMGET